MKRLLVTTALEETWGDGMPAIFLGERCRLYNRKHIWSEMDALVARPYGIQSEQKLSNITYIDTLTSQILTGLTKVLNKQHQAKHSESYWNIILGHWLKRYVCVAFNHYYTLDQTLKKYEVAGAITFKDANYNLATSSSRDFIFACNDDQWSHVFYSRIMSFRGDVELNQVSTPLSGVEGFCGAPKLGNGRPQGIVGRMVKKLARAIVSLASGFCRDADAFIITSYLPMVEEIKLQLALGQVPQLWKSPRVKQIKSDSGQRASLALNYNHFDGFERYVRWQLPEIIPACYLEGYADLIKEAKEMPWPKKPRFIFTSNCFDTDEVFKVWTAIKVEQGTPYIAGQHGNNFGTHKWMGNKCMPERVTSDKYISWGWTEGDGCVPGFVFTCAGRKPSQVDDVGGLLLIENILGEQNTYFFDIHHDFTLYMEEQFCFVENLPERIHKRLTVRLHREYSKARSFEDLRWKDRSPHTQLEEGIINIRKLIKQSRLVVYSYDSTGILEALAMNIPIMCFWRDGLNHLLPSAKPYYELLADAGILFFSPEEIAKSIALHWDDISGWWESEKVQDARQIFCDQYARTVPRPVLKLKKILTEDL